MGPNPNKPILVWLRGCDGGLDKPTKLSFSEKALGRAVIGSTCRTYRSPPFPFHKALSITLEALG